MASSPATEIAAVLCVGCVGELAVVDWPSFPIIYNIQYITIYNVIYKMLYMIGKSGQSTAADLPTHPTHRTATISVAGDHAIVSEP